MLLCMVWLMSILCCSGQKYLGMAGFQIRKIFNEEYEGSGTSGQGEDPYIYAYNGDYTISCYLLKDICVMSAVTIKGSDLNSAKKILMNEGFKCVIGNFFQKDDVAVEIVYKMIRKEYVTYYFYDTP